MGAYEPQEHGSHPAGGPKRLTRVMSSRRLQALDFIKRYYLEWSQSPTLGEISAELGVSAKRAHELVDQLVSQRLIERVPGKTRGIRLIDPGEELSEADVLVRLAGLGWTIGLGERVLRPPDAPGLAHQLSETLLHTLTEKGLRALPRLDHDPSDLDGTGTDGSKESEEP